jgi:hypothetical protein
VRYQCRCLQILTTAALLLLTCNVHGVFLAAAQEYKAKLVAEGKFLAPTVPLSPVVSNTSLKMNNERISDVGSESLKALRQVRRTSVLQTSAASATAATAAAGGGATTATTAAAAAGALSSPQRAGSVQLTAVVAPEDALHASPGAMRRASRAAIPLEQQLQQQQHRSSSAGMRHTGSAPSMSTALSASNSSSSGAAAAVAVAAGGRRVSVSTPLPPLGEGSFDGFSAGAGPAVAVSSPSGASQRRTSVLVSPSGLSSSSAGGNTAGSQRGSVTAASGSSRRASVVAGAAGNRRASQAPLPLANSGSSNNTGLVPTRSSVKLSVPIEEGTAQQQQQQLVSPSSASSRRKSTAVHVPGALFAGMEVYDQQQQQQAAARRRSSKVIPPLSAAAAGRRMSTSPVRA